MSLRKELEMLRQDVARLRTKAGQLAELIENVEVHIDDLVEQIVGIEKSEEDDLSEEDGLPEDEDGDEVLLGYYALISTPKSKKHGKPMYVSYKSRFGKGAKGPAKIVWTPHVEDAWRFREEGIKPPVRPYNDKYNSPYLIPVD